MVNPVNVPPGSNQSVTPTSRTPDGVSVPDGLSPTDMQALRRTSQRDNRRGAGKQTAGAEAERSRGTAAAAARRAGSQGQNVSRFGSMLGGPRQTDRQLSRPLVEFDVDPMAPGTNVLSANNGDMLFNLRGPLANAIAERLASTMPKSEKPTLWLGESYGRISVTAIRKHLNNVISPNEGNAIAVRSDGVMELRMGVEYRDGDTLVIGRTPVDDGKVPIDDAESGVEPLNAAIDALRSQASSGKPASGKGDDKL